MIRFTETDSGIGSTNFHFKMEEPMILLKNNFINQAFLFMFSSLPECVDQMSHSSFQAVLGVRIPQIFDVGRILGEIDKSNHYLKVKNEIWRQPVHFEKQEDGYNYKVTLFDIKEGGFDFLTYILGLELPEFKFLPHIRQKLVKMY